MNAPELRDIHLPEASLWWPPGPGWWGLALLLAALAFGAWWLRRRLRFKSVARLSLAEPEPGANGLVVGARFREAGRDVLRLSVGEHVVHARVEATDLAGLRQEREFACHVASRHRPYGRLVDAYRPV